MVCFLQVFVSFAILLETVALDMRKVKDGMCLCISQINNQLWYILTGKEKEQTKNQQKKTAFSQI